MALFWVELVSVRGAGFFYLILPTSMTASTLSSINFVLNLFLSSSLSMELNTSANASSFVSPVK